MTDKVKFLYNLAVLENSLQCFLYEDYTSELEQEIKRNLFALIKVSAYFDEYLVQVKEVHFKPKDFMYNKGHHKDREAFQTAKQKLLTIIDMIRRETNFGALDDISLVKPNTVTFTWLWENVSAKAWWLLLGLFFTVAVFFFNLGMGF